MMCGGGEGGERGGEGAGKRERGRRQCKIVMVVKNDRRRTIVMVRCRGRFLKIQRFEREQGKARWR